MSTGAVKPCQIFRLNSGVSAPRMDLTASCRDGPMVCSGKMPTSKHASTRRCARRQHAARRLMRCSRQISSAPPEEHAVDEARGVRHAEHARQRGDGGQVRSESATLSPAKIVSAKNISFERNPLSNGTPAMAAAATIATVAVTGMALRQTTQAPHVARAGFVIDDARCHEQRRLERRVIHHVEHGGDQRQLDCSSPAAA